MITRAATYLLIIVYAASQVILSSAEDIFSHTHIAVVVNNRPYRAGPYKA
jgi:hypothetical protein